MKTLIVEDNDLKFALLAQFTREVLRAAQFARAASYQAGIEALVDNHFELVLLDMSLPVSDLAESPVGMDFLTFGGELVLRECRRRHIATKFIVISQYDSFVRDNEEVSFNQLREEILENYPNLVVGCVHLDRSSDAWQREVVNLVQNEGIDC